MKHLFYRQALYERIWTETPTRVAADLRISTVLLKQACHRAAIPLPTMAYWSGLRAGKNLERTPLPPRPLGADYIVTVGYLYFPERPAWSAMLEPVFEEPVEAMAARFAPTLAATTPASVRGNFNRIAMQRVAQPLVGKKVAPPKPSSDEQRRYQLIADLCSLLERSGSAADASEDEKGRRFTITIYAAPVPVHFSGDGAEQVFWLSTEDEALRYADGPEMRIEDRLHEIASALLIAAERCCRAREQRAYENELADRQRAEAYDHEDRQRRKERADRRRRERAKERRGELVEQASRWSHAENIRAFVAKVLADFPPDGVPSKLGGWAEWALREAAAIDPIPELHRNPPERRQTDNPL